MNTYGKSTCIRSVPVPSNEMEYSHSKQLDRVEVLNKTLNQLKEKILKTRVRCAMLHVDLATQFSPATRQAANEALENCHRCSATILAMSEKSP